MCLAEEGTEEAEDFFDTQAGARIVNGSRICISFRSELPSSKDAIVSFEVESRKHVNVYKIH